ncbi:MAG: hypothetical protein Q4B70_09195 [Lachnospiraceae bacterium]|nr:hypothetical protein [Lachnospiraceae bacterium]
MDTMKLNDGSQIPSQGFGVFMVENDGPCEEAVKAGKIRSIGISNHTEKLLKN